MNHMELLKGIGIGLAVGCTIRLAVSSGKRKRRKCKSHAIRALGKTVNSVTGMLGF